MAHLRIAEATDTEGSGIAAAAQQAITRVLAEKPVALVILYEVAGGVGWVSVPASAALVRGMVREASDELETPPAAD